MGRSPVLATVTLAVSLPSFNSTSLSAGNDSPGIIPPPLVGGGLSSWRSLDYGVVDGNELNTVGEGGFDCHLIYHLGDAFHNIIMGEDGGAETHQVGDTPAVAGAFEELGGDEGDGLRVVELQAPVSPATGNLGGGEDHQLLLFPRRELHALLLSSRTTPAYSETKPDCHLMYDREAVL